MMVKRSAHILVLSVAFLVALGVVMLISTTAYDGGSGSEDLYFNVKRQISWVLLGVAACVGLASLDYHFLMRFAWPFYAGVAVLLVLCFVPMVGLEIHGERRWISGRQFGLGGFAFQPSELAKIAMVVVVARWYAMRPDGIRKFGTGFALPLMIAGLLVGLVLFEVDMGTAAVLSVALFALLFVAGVRWRYLGGLAASGVAAFIAMLVLRPNRVARLQAFIDPEAHRADAGLQQFVALMALGSGGIDGRGLGSGRLKMLYMPFAHTDFIFPMVGEELGLFFTLAVVFSFVMIAVAGVTIAFHARDRFGQLLGLGIVCVLCGQAILNLGVTTSLLPNTGLPLPFVSYGGSSLLVSLAAVGILLNIYRQGIYEDALEQSWVRRRRITPRL